MKIEHILKKYLEPEAKLLLSFVIKKPKEYILAHPEYKISLWQKIKFDYLWKKMQSGIPFAYITGHKEFFNLDFLVNKHTLIPRPDTETLVDNCIDEISNFQFPISNSLLIDIGTGTGCVPISILKRLNKLSSRDPQGRGDPTVGLLHPIRNDTTKITAVATDISKKALKIAKKNAKKHSVKIKFLQGDLLSPVLHAYKLIDLQALIITANLPYLKEEWWKNEPSIQKEPKSSLVSDNKNGLELYEKLLQQITEIKKILDIGYWIFLEIDPRQSSEIFKLIQKYLPKASIEIIKDLSNFDRVVKIKIS